tara:strand:+ start:492 stop:740 length:249 start_codon:yes stop_codon:yes gene_type:complete
MNPIEKAYAEGWVDRHSIEDLLEEKVHVSVEKDWLKSNSSTFLESLERKWEWRYEEQLSLIRTLEDNAVKLRKEIRALKKVE